MHIPLPTFTFICVLAINIDHWREDKAVEHGCPYRQTYVEHASQEQTHRVGQGHARSLQQLTSDWCVLDQIAVTAGCSYADNKAFMRANRCCYL